ncbi:hypothetical protein P4B35_20055 [Pontiellaceae bacterium B12227]|nr:hypothetical protein [Pontiellaceae bacterium B12227]
MKLRNCSLAVMLAVAVFPAAIPTFGTVHFELNFNHTYSDYCVFAELSATNPTPNTVHKVVSPDGRIWKDTDGNENSAAYIWTNSFEGLLSDCTNGLWTLILNEGDQSVETNWFSVSASNFTAATFGNPEITYPVDGSTITSNQPTIQWTGPSHLPELYVQITSDDYSFYESTRPGSSATSWTVPSPLAEDSYSVFINYEHKDFKKISTTAPTNSSGTALTDWTNKFGIASYTWVDFSVTTPPTGTAPLGAALEAYYLPWTTGGGADWFSQTDDTWDGVDAAQSGPVGLGETSWIETTVTNKGTMQFWIMIDADENDYVKIEINGSSYDYLSEYADWEPYEYNLDAGDTIRWTFSNDDDSGMGADVAFLDQVKFGEWGGLGWLVDAPQLEWTTGGDGDWAESWEEPYDQMDAAESANGWDIGTGGESWIETTIQGPGTCSFAWQILADTGDHIDFEKNGSPQESLYGEDGWDVMEVTLDSGPNTLRWTFWNNDGSGMSYDAAFLDQVIFTPAGAVEPDYEADMDFRIRCTKVGTNEVYYSVYPSINDYAPTNSEIEVVSPNELCGGGHHVLWYNVFNTLEDVIAECQAGPWTLYYDRDTPEEKAFTFTVTLPTLSTNDLPPVSITSPVQGAVGVSPNPAYTWTGPTNYTSLRAFLYNEEHGGYIDISHSMPATTTSWTNAATAPEVTNRFFVTYNDHSYWDIEISDPLDASSNPLNFWNEWTWLESQHRITYDVGGIVPQPVTMLPPALFGGNMALSFLSQSGATHFVEWSTNLVTGPWLPATNFPGDGSTNMVTLPTTNPAAFFRVETQ